MNFTLIYQIFKFMFDKLEMDIYLIKSYLKITQCKLNKICLYEFNIKFINENNNKQ